MKEPKTADWLQTKAYRGFKKIRGYVRGYLQKVVFQLRTFSLRSRKKNIQLFDRRVVKTKVFFTTDLMQTGFSDQLFGFKFLYNIGINLGFYYTFSPLKSHRSSIPFLFEDTAVNHKTYTPEILSEKSASVFDFLGINEGLKKLSVNQLPKGSKTVKVDLSTFSLEKKNFNSIKELTDYLKSKLVHLIDPSKTTVFVFTASPTIYFAYYQLICKQAQSAINYKEFYNEHHQKKPKKSHFEPCAIKILTHIRQGDTAVIKTPWGTYIPVWYKLPGRFTQFDMVEDVKSTEFLFPMDFQVFLRDLFEEITHDSSTLVFSDGFKKSFLQIYSKSKRTHISEDEISRLKEIEHSYDENQFRLFDDLPGTKKVIGEEPEKLFTLMEAFFEADILIAGTQQMMIPKLVAAYRNGKDMPLLIVLHKGQKIYTDFLGLDTNHTNIIQVDVNNVDIRLIAGEIRAFMLDNKVVL